MYAWVCTCTQVGPEERSSSPCSGHKARVFPGWWEEVDGEGVVRGNGGVQC